jgi:hypothetical protein
METDVSRAMQYVRSSQEEMMQLVSTMSEQAIVKKQSPAESAAEAEADYL